MDNDQVAPYGVNVEYVQIRKKKRGTGLALSINLSYIYTPCLCYLSCSRGVGAMELIAMQLKAEGRLVSRTLSFEGCEFELLNLVNTKVQVTDCTVCITFELVPY